MTSRCVSRARSTTRAVSTSLSVHQRRKTPAQSVHGLLECFCSWSWAQPSSRCSTVALPPMTSWSEAHIYDSLSSAYSHHQPFSCCINTLSCQKPTHLCTPKLNVPSPWATCLWKRPMNSQFAQRKVPYPSKHPPLKSPSYVKPSQQSFPFP